MTKRNYAQSMDRYIRNPTCRWGFRLLPPEIVASNVIKILKFLPYFFIASTSRATECRYNEKIRDKFWLQFKVVLGEITVGVFVLTYIII